MENGKQPISATLTYNEVSGQPNGHLLGLTKREYFAGLAMQGIMANQNLTSTENDTIAKWSVEIADALLAELEKE
jgi:hypothetical protein